MGTLAEVSHTADSSAAAKPAPQHHRFFPRLPSPISLDLQLTMASEYFATVQVEDVDIVKFLNAACPPGLVDVNAYQKAIDSYIKSLNSLVDDENLPKSARDHAASLMDRYRTVCPTPTPSFSH